MSAITGILNLNNNPISPVYINNLMEPLEKFPADDMRVLIRDNVALGCLSQWITPESVNEILPYYNSESQLAITADAILDNREDLFEKLQIDNKSRCFITDSELIMLTYQKFGEEVPKYLIGEFTFMIWDEKEKKLFGARDFSGSRTLYFNRSESHFSFCTIIEPLFKLPFVKKQLNEEWFAEYLTIPGMNEAVNTSITPFKEVEQLPPAHCIRVQGENVRISRYCTIETNYTLKLQTNEEYEESFRDVFQTAVNSRLRTKREVGAHLSGGLDSGTVASFAAKSLLREKKALHTFSYIPSNDFKDWTPLNKVANEKPFIKSTVDFVGNIKDYYSDFKDVNPLKEVDDWLEIMEMPYKFFGNSVWIKGIFELASEKNVGILLNGGRGNLSVSWGPAMNYYALLLKRMKFIKLYRELNKYSKRVGGNRLRRIPILSRIAFPQISNVIGDNEIHHFPSIINPELASRTRVYEKLNDCGVNISEPTYGEDVFEIRKRHFKELYTWNATGTLGTKLSLRYKIWKRDPTNDIRVIRHCLSLPEDQYVQNGLDRSLIRRSTKGYLPDDVRLNHIRGAQGVDTIHRMLPYWDSFINELDEISKDSIMSDILNKVVIKKIIKKVRFDPKPELSLDPDFWVLMRSLVIYRYIKIHY
ncbi:asparagine synthetase B family protein [Litchfieldia alkalitelluris]|uniref:asparagine synthetase B family protein n=1 Tax=Litchfieldia alkalitelluris TaxID=304268 RepID=UPI000996C391|nr:asparagine synthetase B [Litchfieldia alkalitelluris]